MATTISRCSHPRACAVLAALSSIALLALATGFRFTLERSMPLHMLVQMPMLLGAGVTGALAASCAMRYFRAVQNRLFDAFARCVVACGKKWNEKWDKYGIVSYTFFLLLSAYWMIPKSLDDVLVSPTAETLKFAGFFLAGGMLPGTMARANRVTQLFFLGNFGWMMAIVGMLYQDTAVRLCNAYLLDDQVVAGEGLVVLSIAIPTFWALHAIRSNNIKTRSII